MNTRDIAAAIFVLTLGSVSGCVCGGPGSRSDANSDGTTLSDARADSGGATDAVTDAAGDSGTAGTDAAPSDAGRPILFPCGPSGLECDAAREVCVELFTVGAPSMWQCDPLPPGCQGNHTCACVGQAFGICPPSFWWCSDLPEDYTVRCEWLKI